MILNGTVSGRSRSSVDRALDSVVGAHVPVTRVRVSRRDGRSMSTSPLTGVVAAGGRPQSGESERTDLALLCAMLNIRL